MVHFAADSSRLINSEVLRDGPAMNDLAGVVMGRVGVGAYATGCRPIYSNATAQAKSICAARYSNGRVG